MRRLARVFDGMPASDGAGVRLTRLIGQPALMQLDPFLLLDAFRSDDPDDYVAGFPEHPHRGFETVTYLLNGRMRHADNTGRSGVIEAGGIQWMTAGRGIVHSEMPEQQDGLLEGFQLWINLPSSHKLCPPGYQEHGREHIPVESRPGSLVRVVCGATSRGTRGPVEQPLTDPLYLDVALQAGAGFAEDLPAGHNAFLCPVSGSLNLPDVDAADASLAADQIGILSPGERVEVRAGDDGVRFLLVAGKPLGEPIARGGPFVMNTEAELRQAFVDYQSGNF